MSITSRRKLYGKLKSRRDLFGRLIGRRKRIKEYEDLLNHIQLLNELNQDFVPADIEEIEYDIQPNFYRSLNTQAIKNHIAEINRITEEGNARRAAEEADEEIPSEEFVEAIFELNPHKMLKATRKYHQQNLRSR